MKKKILFVMPRLGTGGAEKSLLMLLHLLEEFPQVSVDLLLFKKDGLLLQQVPQSVTILEQETSLKAAYSGFSLSNCRTLRSTLLSLLRPFATVLAGILTNSYNRRSQLRWVKCYRHLIAPMQEQYDVAIGFLDGEAIYYVADKVSAQCKIGWNHNDYQAIHANPEIDRRYYEKLDYIATISDECTAILKKVFPEQADKMVQIPNVITPGYLRSHADAFLPAEYDSIPGTKLLSIGRLTHQKGFDLAIEAAAKLKEKNIPFHWFVLGAGELQSELENLIRQHRVEDCFTLLGERSNPYPYIANADILVQTSRFEGKSIVLSEAKVLHKPILVTDYPTVADQITHGHNGVVVHTDSQSIAEGLADLISNAPLQHTLVQNLMHTDFEDATVKQQYAQLFRLDNET